MEEIHHGEETIQVKQSSIRDTLSISSSTEFTIGQLVALRSDPIRVGVIINILPGTSENRYLVFIDNTPSMYYASQLQPHELPSPSFAITPLQIFQGLSYENYRLERMCIPFLSSVLSR